MVILNWSLMLLPMIKNPVFKKCRYKRNTLITFGTYYFKIVFALLIKIIALYVRIIIVHVRVPNLKWFIYDFFSSFYSC